MSTTTAPPAGFDADARAREREEAGVTVGGTRYKPVRKTTEVMKDVRRCGRVQERCERRATRLEREAAELYAKADDGAENADELERQADELTEQADAKRDEGSHQTFVMLAALVADEHGTHPEPQALAGALDLLDAQDLAAFLMPNPNPDSEGDGEPDPTPTPGTTTT